MPLSTVQKLEQALKTIYLNPLIKTIDEESGPVFKMIEKSSENIVGDKIRFALQYGRHGGIGARGEDDDLPKASPRQYIQGTLSPKNLYAVISFTEKLMKISANNAASYADQVTTQMSDIASDAKDMMRRNFMGKADGIMATVASGSGKNVVVKENIKVFYVGQLIDIFAKGTPNVKKVDSKMIVDVDYSTNTIVLESTATVAADDCITLAGNYNKELIGLGDIMDVNSVLYGIDRANNKWYNPHIFDKKEGGDNVAFSSMYLQEAIDEIEDFTGKKPDFICCDAGMQRAYIAEQNAYKRNLEYKDIDGGYRTLSYNDVPISKEKYMPKNTMYLLTTEFITLAQLADWSWMDADGAVLSRVPAKAAYSATLTKYAELICKYPASQALITGIEEV